MNYYLTRRFFELVLLETRFSWVIVVDWEFFVLEKQDLCGEELEFFGEEIMFFSFIERFSESCLSVVE